MLRYAYMITCFQEIVNHLIIFWYTFGKTVTDDHHTFRPFRLIKFNMKFRCPSCFALSVFLCSSNKLVPAVCCQIWFYFISHCIFIIFFLYDFHIRILQIFASLLLSLLLFSTNNTVDFFLIVKYQYDSSDATEHRRTKSRHAISRSVS